MEQYNFNRKYSLTVTKPTDISESLSFFVTTPKGVGSEPPSDGVLSAWSTRQPLGSGYTTWKSSSDFRTIERKTTVINDLQMTATIKNNSNSSGTKGSTTTIKIFNLRDETRDLVCNKNNIVTLKAGYKGNTGDLPIVFTGQVIKCFTKREGHDIITYLECSEGAVLKNTIRVSLDAATILGDEPRDYADVFRALAKIWNANGVATGKLVLDKYTGLAPVVETSPQDTPLTKGYTFSGYLRKSMDSLCKDFNYTWQIVNNQLFIHPIYYKDMVATVNVSSDQIISIESNHGVKTDQSTNEEGKGVTVKLLLDGRINTTNLIRVADGRFKGTYKVVSVSHSLSYEGNDWNTTLECEGTS